MRFVTFVAQRRGLKKYICIICGDILLEVSG